MREIKFRAKCLSDGRLVYGAYHKHLPYTPAAIRNEPIPEKDYQHCIIQDGFSDWNMPRGFDGFEVDPKTVGQLTGLKDKNGVEIYEGDIVKYHNRKDSYELHQIIYEEKAAAFLLFGANPASRHPVFVKYLGDIVKAGKSYDIRTYELCEVIGNIYENPELLEAK